MIELVVVASPSVEAFDERHGDLLPWMGQRQRTVTTARPRRLCVATVQVRIQGACATFPHRKPYLWATLHPQKIAKSRTFLCNTLIVSKLIVITKQIRVS